VPILAIDVDTISADSAWGSNHYRFLIFRLSNEISTFFVCITTDAMKEMESIFQQ